MPNVPGRIVIYAFLVIQLAIYDNLGYIRTHPCSLRLKGVCNSTHRHAVNTARWGLQPDRRKPAWGLGIGQSGTLFLKNRDNTRLIVTCESKDGSP